MMVILALVVVTLIHPFPRGSWVLPLPCPPVRCLLLVMSCCVAWCFLHVADVTMHVAQSCMGPELPTPVTAFDVACPVAIASSVVAPAISAAAIACCARWAAIAASCASICSVAALLVVSSAAACCHWVFISAFFQDGPRALVPCKDVSSVL
jgi:hypothetical protein